MADIVNHAIGIDADRDRVTASLVEASTGGELATATFETTRRGYGKLVAWADRATTAALRAWAVEGSGSYRSGACAHLGAVGEWVIEFGHPHTAATSDGAKTDALDALGAAREVLGRADLAIPRAGRPRSAPNAGNHPSRRPDSPHRGDQRTQGAHRLRARRTTRPAPEPHHRRPGRQMRRLPTTGRTLRRTHGHQTGPPLVGPSDQHPRSFSPGLFFEAFAMLISLRQTQTAD